MNIPLRLAILQSPIRTQIRLSATTGIRETRLSRIVNGWVSANAEERQAIAVAIGRPVEQLFSGSTAGGSAAA